MANADIEIVYPETAHRSLESIDALFSANSLFNWKMERNYRKHGDVLAEHGVDLHGKHTSMSDVGSNKGGISERVVV